MPNYIYEITMFDDTKFISSSIKKLLIQLNDYIKEKEIYDIVKNEKVLMKITEQKLTKNIHKLTKIKYPLKSVEKHHCYDYFKEEMLERFPTSFNNEPLRCYYVRKLCKEKGI